MDNLFDLTGKVALVTGSSKGIGRAIVERMAQHGARVVVSSRKADVCDEVAAAINETQGAEVAAAIPCNISHKEELEQLVAKTREKWGSVDALVCNDPDAVVRWAITASLPPEFHVASCFWQLSASTHPVLEGFVSIHAWFCLDRAADWGDLEAWLIEYGNVDVVSFRDVQKHYCARPTFEGWESSLDCLQ